MLQASAPLLEARVHSNESAATRDRMTDHVHSTADTSGPTRADLSEPRRSRRSPPTDAELDNRLTR